MCTNPWYTILGTHCDITCVYTIYICMCIYILHILLFENIFNIYCTVQHNCFYFTYLLFTETVACLLSCKATWWYQRGFLNGQSLLGTVYILKIRIFLPFPTSFAKASPLGKSQLSPLPCFVHIWKDEMIIHCKFRIESPGMLSSVVTLVS